MPRPHPLRRWLAAVPMSTEAFATKHAIAFRALYDQCDGKLDPRLSTLLAIEKATKKAVTVQMVADWFRRRTS